MQTALSLLHTDLQEVYRNQPFNQAYQDVFLDLNAHQERLTSTELRYALETILALYLLESHSDFLSMISNEDQRNQQITDLTHLIAEPGLVPGSHSEEIQRSIQRVSQLFFKTYIFDKEREDTISLYREGFKGPPCFNGRIITLEEYFLSKQGKDPKSISDITEYDALACQYLELLYDCNGDEPVDYATFIKHLKSLKNYSDHRVLVESSLFEKIYRRACELFV